MKAVEGSLLTALQILSKLLLRDLCLFQDGFEGPPVNFFVVRNDQDGSGLIVSYLDVAFLFGKPSYSPVSQRS